MRTEIPETARAPEVRRTLLIVDDEEGPRQSLWAIFKDDYEILVAENGNKALALVEKQPVDAAVLDIRMPDMSGTELLERLKRIDPAIEVVMLTAYQTVETAREALKHGACEYLTKPFEISAMAKAVGNAMDRRAVSEQIQINAVKLRELQEEVNHQKVNNELATKKGEIYASILHDINNPMTVISALIDLMNSQVAAASKVEGSDLMTMRTRLAQTNRQLANCIQITRRYLSFLKPRPQGEASVDVNLILADLGELLRTHPSIKKNELAIDPLGQDALALINGIDFVQILLNLVVNALQCSPDPHRVEVRSRLLEEPLDLKGWPDSAHSRMLNRDNLKNVAPLIEIEVSDNGPGMSAETFAKIFDPYFTTRPSGKGTGLGLAIVLRLTTEAQGAIFAESKPGQGTSFKIYLPGRALGQNAVPRFRA